MLSFKIPQKWLFCLSLPVAIWFCGFFSFLIDIPTEVYDPTTHTEAIVVLTGGGERFNTGVALLRIGLAKRLFVSGVHKGVDVSEILKASHLDLDAVTAQKIDLGHSAEDTVGNAEETAQWVKANDIHSIRLVTAAYHMQRSLWEFKRLMPTIEIIANPVYPEVKMAGWSYMHLLASEYGKYVVIRVRSFFSLGTGT